MGATYDCIGCYKKNLERLVRICDLDPELGEAFEDILAREARPTEDGRVHPQLMGELWEQMAPLMGTDDPYRDVKAAFNRLLLEREPDCERALAASDDPYQLALRYSAAGNLIDVAPGHDFGEDAVHDLLAQVPGLEFAIDDSESLHEAILAAKKVVVLADNCGEIVLDKVLIRQLARERPDCDFVYVVRGGNIQNDVTMVDAEQVGIGEVARVVSSGAAIPCTVPARSSAEMRREFYDADVVIAKGMGNYESLGFDWARPDIWYLMMAKCEVVADHAHAPLMSLVCLRGPNADPEAAA